MATNRPCSSMDRKWEVIAIPSDSANLRKLGPSWFSRLTRRSCRGKMACADQGMEVACLVVARNVLDRRTAFLQWGQGAFGRATTGVSAVFTLFDQKFLSGAGFVLVILNFLHLPKMVAQPFFANFPLLWDHFAEIRSHRRGENPEAALVI